MTSRRRAPAGGPPPHQGRAARHRRLHRRRRRWGHGHRHRLRPPGDPHVAAVTCLWYGSWRTRKPPILARNEHTASGYDLALVTTDPDASPATLVTRYAARWGIEQAFADARNVLGAGEARNRVRRAVERTVPFAMLCTP